MQSALIEKVVCSTPPAVYTSGPEYRPWAWCWTSPKAPKPESRANRRSCARRRSEYASPQADWYRKVGLQELISHLASIPGRRRSEEHTSELQSLRHLVCRLLLDPAPTEIYTLSLHDALPI